MLTAGSRSLHQHKLIHLQNVRPTYDIDSASIPPDVAPPELSAHGQALLCNGLVVVRDDAVHEVLKEGLEYR